MVTLSKKFFGGWSSPYNCHRQILNLKKQSARKINNFGKAWERGIHLKLFSYKPLWDRLMTPVDNVLQQVLKADTHWRFFIGKARQRPFWM